jgi:hypothetical protein
MELDETTTNSIIAIITALGSVVAAITVLMRELRRGHPVHPEEEVEEVVVVEEPVVEEVVIEEVKPPEEQV